MGCLSEFGKLGLTSIGDSPQQAKEIYHRVVKVLDEETRATTSNPSWPSQHSPPIAGTDSLRALTLLFL